MRVPAQGGRAGLAAAAILTLLSGSGGFPVRAQAQSVISPPVARFYGHVTVAGGRQLPINTGITATVNGVNCNASVDYPNGGSPVEITGSKTDNAGNYLLDIQAVPGCTTPGTSVSFASSGLTAVQHGTIPEQPGAAIHLDLTFQPPPPTRAPAAAAPAPVLAPPRPAATMTPVVPARPPNTGVGPGPAKPASRAQAPQAKLPASGPIVAQAPARAAAAPSTKLPRLPSAGTGGLIHQQSSGMSGWTLAAVLLVALGIGLGGLVAYRRD